MESQGIRRSDRIYLELPIQISGTDDTGRDFVDAGQTLVLSRHGAKIQIRRMLSPAQEVNVRCMKTGREAMGRVIGQIGELPEGFLYGVSFLDAQANPWDIEFVAEEDTGRPVGRVVMECLQCKTVEVVHLDEFEVEVLEANEVLSRSCKHCGDMRRWQRSSAEPPVDRRAFGSEKSPESGAAAPGAGRSRNDRKHVRLNMKVRVCVRTSQRGDDVVLTENFSRGGLRFKSQKFYPVGTIVDVALPYDANTANIFTPTKILYASEISSEGLRSYGAQYLHPPTDKGTK
jgi:PilZ domain